MAFKSKMATVKATGLKIKAVLTVVVFMLVLATIVFSMIDEFAGSSDGDDGKSHACTQDVMHAIVFDDGSLRVSDARTYEFHGSYTLTAAVLDPPAGGEAIVHSVTVTDADGITTKLTEVPFDTKWRRAGGPPSGYYSVDEARDTVYAFSSTTDATKTFTFEYTYTNAVEQYADVSVLYWQFIGPNWDVATNNVTAYLRLPVPAGQSVEGGQNVYAFGHGDLGGEVSFEPDGIIDFTVPKVKSGTFAEMRVAFPASWTPDVSQSCVRTGNGLPGVLSEEEQWQREAQTQRIINLLTIVIPILVSLICIIIALVLFFRYGREYKPQFDGEYWRDVPEKGTNPAVIGRLMRWNKSDANDMVAVLMNLSKKGIISIDRESTTQDRMLLPDKEVVSYRLTLDPVKRDALAEQLDPIETEALSIVFTDIAGGNTSVTLDDISAYAEDKPNDYVSKINGWQTKVEAEVSRRNFFERTGNACRTGLMVGAVVLFMVGLTVTGMMENFIPFLGVLPGVIVMLVIGVFMPRRSREAVEIQARSEGLKRWFKDFTNLKEAVPTDAKVWGELLVYAYLFGVMDQVVEGLNRTAPEVWNDPTFAGSMWWYYSPYSAGRHVAAAGSHDFFGNAFGNTLTTAQGAIAAARSSSGGGGFGGGGGFSGGGGGGFGGGGGGFSR